MIAARAAIAARAVMAVVVMVAVVVTTVVPAVMIVVRGAKATAVPAPIAPRVTKPRRKAAACPTS